MRAFAVVLIVIGLTDACAQQSLRVISLPTQDSTMLWHFMEHTGGGYAMSTAQPEQGANGSTLITTDEQGMPTGALRLDDQIYRMVRCSDGGYLMMIREKTLIKTDAAFSVVWAKKLVNPLPTQSAITEIAENNGYVYAVCNVQVAGIDPSLSFYNTYAAVIFRFNNGGDLVAQQVLADTVFSSGRKNLYLSRPVAGDDGSLYLSMGTLAYWASGTCNRVPTIVKLDTALNVDWSYQYPVSSLSGVSGLTRLANGDLALFGGYGTNYPYCTYFKNYLERIDTAGSVLFAKGYLHPFPAAHSTATPVERLDGTLVVPRSFMDTVLGRYVPFFDLLDADGELLATRGFDRPFANNFDGIFQLANADGGAIAACRLNRRDSILFTRFDTTLITPCHSVPSTAMDTSLTVNRTAFMPAYRAYPFVFIDTTYAPFDPVPVSAIDGCDFTTAIELDYVEPLVIYPNPSSGVVNISAPWPIAELTITDAVGRLIHRSKPGVGPVAVMLPASGLYVIRSRDAQGRIVTRRLVKE
jgi:hypothetical protein